MKLGQVLKNALDELSKQHWRKIKKYGFDKEVIDALEISVDPQYSRAIEILINAGLQYLKNHTNKYEPLSVYLANDIYIRVISKVGEMSNLVLSDFLLELESAINQYVKDLSSAWVESNISISELIVVEKYIKEYGKEMLIVEHPSINDDESAILLRILADEYKYDNDVLQVTESTENNNGPRKDFIIGKKDFVKNLINRIEPDLLLSNYYAESKSFESKDTRSTITTLENLCVKAITHLSFFNSAFSLDWLKNSGLPNELIKKIEDPMEQVQDWKDMEKYKDKIIIFKTTSNYLGGQKGYLIDPGKEELKIGMISRAPSDWVGNQPGYALSVLLTPREKACTRALVTSKLKYSDFSVRLPFPNELDKIKEAIQKKEGKFDNHYDEREIIDKIDMQKMESEKSEIIHSSELKR
jgi:hypothetical protein